MNQPVQPVSSPRKNSRRPVFAVAAALVFAGAAAAAAYVYQNRSAPVTVQAPPDTAPPQAVPIPPAETADPIPPTVERPDQGADAPLRSATAYRVAADGEHLAPTAVRLTRGDEPMTGALNAMAGLKNSPLPPGTRALSARREKDGLVIVDFNDAFVKNFPGGDTEEALTLGAITGTLAHFQGVERVQVLVEGQKIDSLGGNQDLKEPLPVRDAPLAASSHGGGGE